MPVVNQQSLELAVQNIARHGDTDIFPLPIENHWFHDAPEGVVEILQKIDATFDEFIAEYPVVFAKELSGVGYTGFRAATQIDPVWNAYLLGLVIQLGHDIEAARAACDHVFSYRYSPDPEQKTLFAPDLGWGSFQREALTRAQSATCVLATDISDFYPRIYHHRLENALGRATQNKEAVRRIKVLLFRLAAETSYGLPVGGNAARLLAELVLNSSDRLLAARGVNFVRFVDDYYFFVESRQHAHAALVTLSESLMHDGLSLARAKTRVMSRAEFVRTSPVADPALSESEGELEARKFLKLRLRYDPYSQTAEEDYDRLSAELEKFDVVGMLTREFDKSRIDEGLVRQLVRSVRFLKPTIRDQAVESLLTNLEVLYPVFPTVVILLLRVIGELDGPVRSRVFQVFREIVRGGSHIVLVSTNLAYALRLLAFDPDAEADALLIATHERPNVSMMTKRDVIIAMARRGSTYWLSVVLRRFAILTPWERRALLVASYTLGDEGRHWRDGVRAQLGAVDQQFLAWVAERNNGRVWEPPL